MVSFKKDGAKNRTIFKIYRIVAKRLKIAFLIPDNGCHYLCIFLIIASI